MSEEQIKALNTKRGIAKRSVTCFENFINNKFQPETGIPELAKRLQELETTRATFESVQQDLDLLVEASDEHENYRIEFDDKYWIVWNKAFKLLETHAPQLINKEKSVNPLQVNKSNIVNTDANTLSNGNSDNSQSEILINPTDTISGSSQPSSLNNNSLNNPISGSSHMNIASLASQPAQIQNNTSLLPQYNLPTSMPFNNYPFYDPNLPPITLPQFSGEIDQWIEFRERFDCVINKNPLIPENLKIIHLKGCLSGQAADVISSLNSVSNNYTIAWNLLQERYHHPKLIRSAYIQNLIDLPSIDKNFTIRSFIDLVQKNIRALQASDQTTENWDLFLIVLLRCKLDDRLRDKWDDYSHEYERPSFKQFISFLDRKARLEITKSPSITSSDSNNKTKNRSQKAYMATAKSGCLHCEGDHPINHCPDFLKLLPFQRYEFSKKAGLCTNCLRSGHRTPQCPSGNCRTCQQRHHTLLHFGPSNNTTNNNATNKDTTITDSQIDASNQLKPNSSLTLKAQISSEAILATALVDIINNQGKVKTCRVFLDAGSQAHFITKSVADFLNLDKNPVHISVSGLDDISTVIKSSTSAIIKSRHNKFQKNAEFLIVPQISAAMPTMPVDPKQLNIPNNIPLADPEFFKPSSVDALIGVKLFYKLLSVGQIPIPNHPNAVFQKTQLGWIVAGEINQASVSSRIVCHLGIRGSLSETDLTRFWEIEELSSPSKTLSPEEKACEEHYARHTTRDASGRYVVRLPFNEKIHSLGNSYSTALKRFSYLESRLHRDPNLLQDYSAFLTEYEQLQHMSSVEDPDINSGFYFPHHAVIKADSTTTKTRVVFDGSCKTSTGISLNDTLMIGPKLQDDLFVILVRYRSHIYAITADAEKMYRQILVHPDDVKYQKILFRKSRHEPIKTYALNTVTYGTSAGAYLAIKSLQQLGEDERANFPAASLVVQNDFYVDDLLSGAETLAKAMALRDELNALLARGGFNLRKWSSNHPALSDNFSEYGEGTSKPLDPEATTKTLGIHWRPSSDTLCYSVKISNSTATKRSILSEIAKLFDPLGLLGPVIVYAKIIMQLCWKSGVTWDESVPQDIYAMWESYKVQLPNLEKLRFTRCLLAENAINSQIHGFCDASEKAYGACIYLRSIGSDGTIYTRLICSKSRVAPVNSVSLPRLELCGALLLSRLYNTVRESFSLPIDDTYFWCDSTITLHWIHTAPYRLKTFVANRVSEIQTTTTNGHWRHIPSLDNPADFISRGQLPAEFVENTMWQTGPSWLTSPEQAWPQSLLPDVTIPELKPPSRESLQCMQIMLDKFDILTKYSSMRTLQRVIAYILRFLHNLKNKDQRRIDALDSQELETALNLVIKLTQSSAFIKEIDCLKSNKTLSDNSNLLQLAPYIDKHGIMRVGGRLSLPSLHNYPQHPILLPSHHVITELIIREEHVRLMHAGPQATLYSVRQKYWPINGRNTVRMVLHRCVRCFRAKPRSADHNSGLLPKCRTEQCRPFLKTGVDFCGPLFIKEKRFRNRNKIKVYIAVFVCMVTKAVHLEVVCDLTTEAFIASLRRFFARRGKSAELHSDNGTNFVGAAREIHDLFSSPEHQASLGKFLESERIIWHFIPPRAPHFGGLWEAAVKSFKKHLTPTVGDTTLTYDQLETYVVEIEAILNSRPLSPMSSDPNDLLPLTAGHFLIGDPMTSLPDTDFIDTPTNRLSAWQHAQKLKQHFWARWNKEYLNNLIQHPHLSKQENLQVGRLVMLLEDNIPPLSWPMGRITTVCPGADGIVRVVYVKTQNGVYKRCVKKLCPLPLE